MNNIKDWCISRQIWWGHRIPAWYCNDCGELIVAKESPDKCRACGSGNLRQDTDVLDTWFSSALWPFSTLGWPDNTAALKTFYPTSALVTGFDILFFWVARMMMMGLHFMNDVPFSHVYIHALVRDAEGKKMSKSKGNVIDPLEVIEQSGTDAFRFTLAAFAAQGRDVKLSEDRIEGYRHFVNKIWNSSRLVLMNMEENSHAYVKQKDRALPDRWILTRVGQVSDDVAKALDEYRFNDAASLCYQFVWHEFCDWYIELSKERLYGNDESQKKSVQLTLKEVLSAVLRLMHPFMPFVTEDIWQRIPGVKESIMKAEFPQSSGFIFDKDALEDMNLVMGIITGVRNIRGEMNIHPSKAVDIIMDIFDDRHAEIINNNLSHIRSLSKAGTVTIERHATKPEASATAVLENDQIHVLLKGIIDFEEEKKRIRKEISKVENDMEADSRKLTSPGFMENAPPDIVEKVKEKVAGLKEKAAKLDKNLKFFEAIND